MSKMQLLSSHHLREAQSTLPSPVISLLRKYHGQLVVAGGFPRAIVCGDQYGDIDLFIINAEAGKVTAIRDEALGTLKEAGFERIKVSSNADTYKNALNTVQVIYRRTTTESPDKLIDSFDLKNVKAAIWWDAIAAQWASAVHPDFYRANAGHLLMYDSENSWNKAETLIRIIKYVKKGYGILPEDLAALVSDVSLEYPTRGALTAALQVASSRVALNGSYPEEV